MRILALVRQSSFAKHVMTDLARAARRIGWTVRFDDLETVDDAEGWLAAARAFDPDLVFSYGLEYYSDPFAEPGRPGPVLADRLPRPAVLFLFDFGYPFDRPWSEHTVPLLSRLQDHRHLLFCWDRDALGRLHELGLRKSFYFPMAVDPDVFVPGPETERTTPLVFVGGPTPERKALLAAVADLGLRLYGYGEAAWRASPALAPCHAGPVLDRERLCRIYATARIAVNVTRAHGVSSLNMRVFEAMAAGCLVLTDDKEDARRLFAEGREIVAYRDGEDLRRKARYFLAHEAERRAIAEAGRRRVLAEHTYTARLEAQRALLGELLREIRILDRADAMARESPAKALAFLTHPGTVARLVWNADNYNRRLASLYAATGSMERARERLAAALAANPRHIESLALALEGTRDASPAKVLAAGA